METSIAEGDKVIAIVIGKGIKAAKELYNKVKDITPNIQKIYTDGNSCYDIAFKELGINNLLEISEAKSKTHMIEAINSSLREAQRQGDASDLQSKAFAITNNGFARVFAEVPKRVKRARQYIQNE